MTPDKDALEMALDAVADLTGRISLNEMVSTAITTYLTEIGKTHVLVPREWFERLDAATKRHPLMVGFAHGEPTRKELQDRLEEINALTAEIEARSKADG